MGWQWNRVEENVLKGIGETAHGSRAAHSMLLIALCLAVGAAAGAGAGTTAPKSIELPATVLAHLPLATPAGNHMVMERQGTKRYLYIEQASKAGYTILEVTQAEFPSFVTRQAPSNANDPAAAKAETAAQDANVPEAPDSASKTAIRSAPEAPETVKLMDLSDPEKPTTLQTFTNVTSFLADGGRGIIYLTNDEGLWVLKFKREHVQQVKKLPPCDLKPDRSPRAQAATDCQ